MAASVRPPPSRSTSIIGRETGQRALVEQPLEPLDHVLLIEAECGGDLGERPLGHRESALQRVDQAAVDRVHHAASLVTAAMP